MRFTPATFPRTSSWRSLSSRLIAIRSRIVLVQGGALFDRINCCSGLIPWARTVMIAPNIWARQPPSEDGSRPLCRAHPMGLRQIVDLVLKPLCAAGLVGVILSAFRLDSFSVLFDGDVLQAVLMHAFLATLCLSVCLLDNRGPNSVANHGGLGLLVGLLMGLILVFGLGARPIRVPSLTLPLFYLLITLATAIVGAAIGLVTGIVRRITARVLVGPADPFDDKKKIQRNLYKPPTGVLARPRIVKFSVAGIGLVFVLLLWGMDGRFPFRKPAMIDTRGVEETLRTASTGSAESANPIRSTGRIWQPYGINTLAFSPDGKYLATSGYGHVVRIWKTADWTSAGETRHDGSITCLAFSPDGRLLYVAGKKGRDPIICRFEWRTGKLDKAFTGQKERVDCMVLSADGRKMFTASGSEASFRIWNTDAGTETVVPSGRFSSPSFVYAPQRDLLLQWSGSGRGSAVVFLEGKEVTGFQFPDRTMAVAITPNEQLIVAARGDSQIDVMYLSTHRLGDLEPAIAANRSSRAWQDPAADLRPAVATTSFPRSKRDQVALAISPDGRQVAVAVGHIRLGICALPDLQLIKQHRFVCRGESAHVRQLAYSPDGKWLMATQRGRTTPRLFDAATGVETMLDEGHGDRIIDLRFSDDGRALRSVGQDGTVCTWDPTTMKMLRRISLPADRPVGHIRPSDGRYMLCPVVVDPKGPVRIVNLDTGQTCCEAPLPLASHGSDASRYGAAILRWVYWLGDQEALCIGYFDESGGERRDHWWRFNCRTGRILREGRLDADQRNALPTRLGAVTEDGIHSFFVFGGGKGSPPFRAGRVDLKTFRTTELGRIDRPVNGQFGLIPGGRYFHLGVNVYDRQTLDLVAAKELPPQEGQIGLVALSPDGSRYAASLSDLRPGAEQTAHVYIAETLTNHVLLAFTPLDHVQRFRFSPNGRQLAIAYGDGTLECRSVPTSYVAR